MVLTSFVQMLEKEENAKQLFDDPDCYIRSNVTWVRSLTRGKANRC